MTDHHDISALQAKKEKAQNLYHQAQARRESIAERLAEVVERIEKMGVTPDNAEEKLEKLKAKYETMYQEEAAKLDGVDL